MSEQVYTADSFYNDIEFKVEDAFYALLFPFSDYLPTLGVSLATTELASAHVAIICDKLEPADDLKRNGNWIAQLKIKVVTLFDETVPEGFDSLRALHRQRCAIVRDNSMILELDTQLSGDDLTVAGFSFGDVDQRVEGRAWVTDFIIHLHSVAGVAE